MIHPMDRRSFIVRGTQAGVGLGLVGRLSSPSLFAQERTGLTAAVMGVNSRGNELSKAFVRMGAEVAYICDVDARAVQTTAVQVAELQGSPPRGITDFRRALDDRSVDILVVAAPDHWHAPAAILALSAGKHVYLEKPCGHGPGEGELLVAAQQRFGKLVQMGNQQRSSPESIDLIQEIRNGVIGRPYYGRAWYANTRGSIGRGRAAPVPEWLDYDLWQGPAPRTPFRDNVVHYNWHWFWRWGTGEICNNGTHEIDVCRWALGVDYPTRVTSSGGRYHFDDDWECPDTQIASFDFGSRATITWEGRSCNGRGIEGRGRGASIHGTRGTAVVDRSGYQIFDQEGNEIVRRMRQTPEEGMDTRGGGTLTDLHIGNFLDCIRNGNTPNAHIEGGHKSQLLCHLGNIAQRTTGALECEPETGRILNSAVAMELWEREYEPAWEPRV